MTEPAAAGIVLDFWFAEVPHSAHFAADPAFDERLRRRFGPLHDILSTSVSAEWTATPRGRLAAVIVLDQFSRNLFREGAAAFANDATARELTNRALARGDDAGFGTVERQFTAMPLMHSETAADQARSVTLYDALGDPDAAAFARLHAATIARFGRFPARNAALGRVSTADELSLLAAHPDGLLRPR